MALPERIFLTGFSFTGKTTVGRLVAEALGWQFVDTDDAVEAAAGKPVARIFDEDGEAHFRELEARALADAAREPRAVVATGGGAPVAEENRRVMAAGLVVCLEARPDTILRRMREAGGAGSERPLLASPDPLARIVALQRERAAFYALADATVRTDALTPSEVADAVVQAWKTLASRLDPDTGRLLPPDPQAFAGAACVVRAASGAYPVFVESGALARLGDRMRALGLGGRAFVVSDDTVLSLHGEATLAALRRAGYEADAFAFPAGEASKRLETAEAVYDWLVSRRAERSDAVVALGGGVVGDLAGFVAATFLRGMPFVQVPTSLLAMVDASIGGKVAVDHREGKNLIGAFYQPRLVVEDVSLLATLPERSLREGYAEVIKHGFIRDPAILDDLERHADALLAAEPGITAEIVARNVRIKADVVSRDERDTTGLRAILNYGHTIGHAIEAATGYGRVLHGEAIAVGMMAAAEIGERIGLTPPHVRERQRALLERFGLPVRLPGVSVDAALDAIALDKKTAGRRVRWVLLRDVGAPTLRSDVPLDLVREVVTGLLR
ncbi:MAG TPA: 3-dehydroquinate synthase [Dehalococcoidia bacterium]|nr:3-dehydroquinate synthase [Dehalococcoidia bacterium]